MCHLVAVVRFYGRECALVKGPRVGLVDAVGPPQATAVSVRCGQYAPGSIVPRANVALATDTCTCEPACAFCVRVGPGAAEWVRGLSAHSLSDNGYL